MTGVRTRIYDVAVGHINHYAAETLPVIKCQVMNLMINPGMYRFLCMGIRKEVGGLFEWICERSRKRVYVFQGERERERICVCGGAFLSGYVRDQEKECTCFREREREREREYVWGDLFECICERSRKRVYVFQREREREREIICVWGGPF